MKVTCSTCGKTLNGCPTTGGGTIVRPHTDPTTSIWCLGVLRHDHVLLDVILYNRHAGVTGKYIGKGTAVRWPDGYVVHFTERISSKADACRQALSERHLGHGTQGAVR